MTLFHRLSWKLALVTGLLVLVTVLAVAIPLYWLTRSSLEDQLADHLHSNIRNITADIDPQLIDFLQQYPMSKVLRDSLEESLNRKLVKFSASAIYIIGSDDNLIITSGNKDNAIQSVLINNPVIEHTRRTGLGFSPLFTDDSGKTYKSAFILLETDRGSSFVLGLDANAQFLKYAQQLRNRVLFIGIIVLLISILAVLVLSQTLTRPLRLLTHFANDIGKGRAEPTRLRDRKDEIGFLGKTMEKMHQEIKEREKDNKQLIASVAHEIRNPLAGMQINAELLLEETRTIADLHLHAKAVAKEIAKLSDIVENFLTYAQPIEATLSEYSIKTLLIETITQVQRDFPNHAIQISGDANIPVHSNKIRHAFFNLLKNACEASIENTPIIVTITTKTDWILISIKNQGEPIAADIQAQIFDIFFSTKSAGVGLGLSITKSVIEQHGGTIRLDHSDSNGTEFVIQLPAGNDGKK